MADAVKQTNKMSRQSSLSYQTANLSSFREHGDDILVEEARNPLMGSLETHGRGFREAVFDSLEGQQRGASPQRTQRRQIPFENRTLHRHEANFDPGARQQRVVKQPNRLIKVQRTLAPQQQSLDCRDYEAELSQGYAPLGRQPPAWVTVPARASVDSNYLLQLARQGSRSAFLSKQSRPREGNGYTAALSTSRRSQETAFLHEFIGIRRANGDGLGCPTCRTRGPAQGCPGCSEQSTQANTFTLPQRPVTPRDEMFVRGCDFTQVGPSLPAATSLPAEGAVKRNYLQRHSNAYMRHRETAIRNAQSTGTSPRILQRMAAHPCMPQLSQPPTFRIQPSRAPEAQEGQHSGRDPRFLGFACPSCGFADCYAPAGSGQACCFQLLGHRRPAQAMPLTPVHAPPYRAPLRHSPSPVPVVMRSIQPQRYQYFENDPVYVRLQETTESEPEVEVTRFRNAQTSPMRERRARTRDVGGQTKAPKKPRVSRQVVQMSLQTGQRNKRRQILAQETQTSNENPKTSEQASVAVQVKRSPRHAPRREVETQFEEPVDEEAAHYSEIAMENALAKPREPVAEKPEGDMYLWSLYDRSHGIRLGDQSEASAQADPGPKESQETQTLSAGGVEAQVQTIARAVDSKEVQTDLYNSDLIARVTQLNRLAQSFQYHVSGAPDSEQLLSENVVMFTKCSNVCQILQDQIQRRRRQRVNYLSSKDAPVDEDTLNELESVIQLMQHNQPHRVEFQNDADFEQRTLNIERLLQLTQLALGEILQRLNQPAEPPKVASTEQESLQQAVTEPLVVEEEVISTEEGEVGEEPLADGEAITMERSNPQLARSKHVKQDMSVRYARLLEPVVIEEQMSSQEGEQLLADAENVQIERAAPHSAKRVPLRQDMAVRYQQLPEREDEGEGEVGEDATTEKKRRIGGRSNSLESQETRRMNKLELAPLDISPRSGGQASPYPTSENESKYSSVPSERARGEGTSLASYQSPTKALDPTDGENIESTVRTSHSSPAKVQRPQCSQLDGGLKLHDYVVDERQNLAECFQTYQIQDFMLSPERAHLKESARRLGQDPASHRSPMLSPNSRAADFSFRNRAVVQLRDLRIRRGWENAYDVMDPAEARAMEEAISFVSPVQNQVLRRGKMVEYMQQPQGGSPARDDELLNKSAYASNNQSLVLPAGPSHAYPITPRRRAEQVKAARDRTRGQLKSLVASSEHSSHYRQSVTPKAHGRSVTPKSLSKGKYSEGLDGSAGEMRRSQLERSRDRMGSTQPLVRALSASEGDLSGRSRGDLPQIDVSGGGSTSSGSQCPPPDDADAQTFLATHLLFSHLMAFDSKKNTLSQLDRTPESVLGARIRTRSRQAPSGVGASRAGSPDASRLRGRSPNPSLQRQSQQAPSRSAASRAFPDYYASPPAARSRARGPHAPAVVRFAQNSSTIQRAQPGLVPRDNPLRDSQSIGPLRDIARDSLGTVVLDSSGNLRQTFNKGKIERLVPYIPEQEDLPKSMFAEKTATFRPTASPEHSAGHAMELLAQEEDSRGHGRVGSAGDEAGLGRTRRQAGAPSMVTPSAPITNTASNEAYEHSPAPAQGMRPQMTSQDHRTSGTAGYTAGYLEPTPMSGLSGTAEDPMMIQMHSSAEQPLGSASASLSQHGLRYAQSYAKPYVPYDVGSGAPSRSTSLLDVSKSRLGNDGRVSRTVGDHTYVLNLSRYADMAKRQPSDIVPVLRVTKARPVSTQDSAFATSKGSAFLSRYLRACSPPPAGTVGSSLPGRGSLTYKSYDVVRDKQLAGPAPREPFSSQSEEFARE